MADKDAKDAKPAPVDVKSSVPLEIKVAEESIAALGGDVGLATAPPVAPTGTPVNVTVLAPPAPTATVTKGEGTTLTPTTTEEEDVASESKRQAQAEMSAGQRAINQIWEKTQSWIAMMVVASGVLINSIIITAIVFLNKEVSVTQLALISISLQFINLTTGIVIGFYFSRTNHSAQGGVGLKPPEAPYTGR